MRTTSRKARLLAEAQALALERADTFRIARRNRAGDLLTGHKLVPVTSTRKRNDLISKGAKPVLGSAAWRAIYAEVGIPVE